MHLDLSSSTKALRMLYTNAFVPSLVPEDVLEGVEPVGDGRVEPAVDRGQDDGRRRVAAAVGRGRGRQQQQQQ